jgi:hypothetical protein
MSATVKAYRAQAAMTGALSAVFAPQLSYQPSWWTVRVLWTAGADGTLTIKSRPTPGVTTEDIALATYSQASGNTEEVFTTLCPQIVATLAQGVGAADTCTVQIIAGKKDSDVSNGDFSWLTVTPA